MPSMVELIPEYVQISFKCNIIWINGNDAEQMYCEDTIEYILK